MSYMILIPLYRMIFDREFDKKDAGSRRAMQNAVYLLEISGVYINDYGYIWHYRGPYSQELQNDMRIAHEDRNYKLCPDGYDKKKIEGLKEIIKTEGNEFLDRMASIEFIRENLLPYNVDDKTILQKFQELRTDISDSEGSRRALNAVKAFMHS